jgi:hypothetical protein
MLINFWLFIFAIFLLAAQSKEFLLDGLKMLEQRSHMCVWSSGGNICGGFNGKKTTRPRRAPGYHRAPNFAAFNLKKK